MGLALAARLFPTDQMVSAYLSLLYCDYPYHYFKKEGSFCVICANRLPYISVPPEELYAAQLSQLQEMGFFDRQENIRALMTTAGNVHAAVERLLGNSGR